MAKIRIYKKVEQDEARVAHYKQFLAELLAWEEAFRKKLKPLFDIQEQEVLEKAEAILKSVPIKELKTKGMKAIDDFIFDEEAQVQVFIRFEKPILLEALGEAGQRILDQIDGQEFTPLTERANRFLDEKTLTFATEVNKTTIKKLKEQLQEGISNGEGFDKIKERVSSVFEVARGSRAEMIARTEVGSAINYGHWEAYQQSEVVEKVEWISTMDSRVRDDHLQADGQKVNKNEKFYVGGEHLQFPRDPLGSPENVINCRCTTRAIIK